MATVVDHLQPELHPNPDAQATVTDFLDCTEYLPSDLTRSLTLIRKLDESYLSLTDRLHELLSVYGDLTNPSTSKRYNAQELRKQISHYLDRALNVRESAYAEASRLYDEVDHHFNRLARVKIKLQALPKPPSRDPSPAPLQLSPQINRIRLGRNDEIGGTPPPRITLRLDNARAAASSARNHDANHRSRHRSRRVTVPGEVLPPPNPDSPTVYTESEWESSSPSPIPMPTSRVGAPPRSRSAKPNRIRIPKLPKPQRVRVPKAPRPPRPPRPPGAMGTNVHSSVAGISTSNALSLLTPPPPNAKPGSVHSPWMRLTEWEMARLRKRMKKNAIWTPSETMIRRELSEAGRGPENYRKTRAKAEETHEEFVDCDNIATTAPGRPLVPGEISADSLGLEAKLSNKGMKLNEAKKLKRELLAREAAALAAAEAEQAAKRLGDIGSSFKSLFSKPKDGGTAMSSPVHSQDKSKNKPITKTPRKRKRDPTPASQASQIQAQLHSEIVLSPSNPSPKKRKIVQSEISTNVTTTTIPLAAPAPLPIKVSGSIGQPMSPTESRRPISILAHSRRPSLTIRGPEPPPESASGASRAASHPASRRASIAPAPDASTRENPRRKSATPAPTPVVTAASRRSKRPAPGPVTSSQDGGAAVSVGRRKNAPRQRGTAAVASIAKKAAEGNAREKEEEVKVEEEAAGEEIDPNEPRYCLCGDVSFGTMICCENADCEKEWFHLECVGLQEPPGRRAKWYCPDCKVKLGKR